jgi:hypothetical protein
MQVFENSITRSEEKDLVNRNKLVKYESKLARWRKNEKEERERDQEEFDKYKEKCKTRKGNKERHIAELNDQAYKEYIEYIQ